MASRHAILRRSGAELVVGGVADVSASQHGEASPDLEAALDGAPAGAPIILVGQEPTGARRAASLGVALQLSGHTHGGMILGLDRVVARANDGSYRAATKWTA